MNTYQVNENQTIVFTGKQTVNVVVEENTNVDLMLHYQKDCVLDLVIDVQENATLNVFHYYESDTLTENQKYNIGRNANVKIAYTQLKKAENIQNIAIDLVGEHSRVEVASGFLVRGKLVLDIQITHKAKHSYANMEHYAVVSDNAHLKLYGVGKIAEKMSGSQAHQTTRVLTMAKDHHCEVTPVLIIDENDVAASHANSIGQPDDMQLYYLQSRGLSIEDALKLISAGYLEPMVQLLEDTSLFTQIQTILEEQVQF